MPLQELSTQAIIDNIPNTVIARSTIHGFGLFATEVIGKNTLLCTLGGKPMTWEDFKGLGEEIIEWNAISRSQLLVRADRTKYSFINHSRKPNCKIVPGPYRVVAAERIAKGMELTLDYRDEPLPLEYIRGKGKYYL